jgi:hypothetical protein
MKEILVIIIVLTLLIINYCSMINIVYENDYNKYNKKVCDENKYEIETYRYNLYNYIFGDKYKKSNIIYKQTTNLILILTIIILIFYILYVYNNKNSKKKIIIIIIYILLLLLFIKVSFNTEKIHKKIYNKVNENGNDLYRYIKVYKILNALLYMDEDNANIKDEILEYSNKDKKNTMTFNDILENNISNYHRIVNTNEIKYKKRLAIERLDILKYMILNEDSFLYFKEYFANIYIIINKKKYYLKELKSNQEINNKIERRLIENTKDYEDDDSLSTKLILNGDKDYIRYLEDNKDIILNKTYTRDNNFKEINNIIEELKINNIIYIIIISIVGLILSHILYKKINDIRYILVLIGIVIVYLVILVQILNK